MPPKQRDTNVQPDPNDDGQPADTNDNEASPDTDAPPADEVIEATVITGPGEPSTGLAKVSAASGELERYVASDHPAVQALNQFLAERATVANEADTAVAEIIAQVLSAKSVDEVLADIPSLGMRELIGRPLIIHGYKAHQSSYEALASWFAYCDITLLDTNERRGCTTGAQVVLAQLMSLTLKDAFPVKVMPVKATKKPTASGYWPYRLSFAPTTHDTVGK